MVPSCGWFKLLYVKQKEHPLFGGIYNILQPIYRSRTPYKTAIVWCFFPPARPREPDFAAKAAAGADLVADSSPGGLERLEEYPKKNMKCRFMVGNIMDLYPRWNFLYVLGGVNPQNSYQNVETQILPKIALLRSAIL